MTANKTWIVALAALLSAAAAASPGQPYAGGGTGPSQAWNVTTAAFLQSKSVTAQDTNPASVFFRSDGLKMYVMGDGTDTVYEYNLSVAWDVTTAALLQSKSVAAQDTNPIGLFFRADGLKMYVDGVIAASIYEYDLSIAWDVTSATFLRSKSVAAQDTAPVGVFFRSDGLKMYVMGTNADSVHEYDLSTAWNVTTAAFLQSKSIAAQDALSQDVFFKPDGLKMYVIGSTNDRVYEYDLSVAWSVTTAAFLQFKSIAAQDGNPTGIFFRADGLKMYMSGGLNDSIYEYNLGP